MQTKVLSFDAVIFDMDGVITNTALIHAAAWKEMFDGYLKKRESEYGETFVEFTHEHDYLPFVDGKPRYNGVSSFLESRGIVIPYGDPGDAAGEETVCGLGNQKNVALNIVIDRDGVSVYPSTLRLILELHEAGIPVGVASSSSNCRAVLQKVNLLHFFGARVDGEVSALLGIPGKPEPDIFTTACDILNVSYRNSIVVEDAVSGVKAASAGGFGLVIGVAREGNRDELLANGANHAISDLDEIPDLNYLNNLFLKYSSRA